MIAPERRWTYRALDQEVDRVVEQLRRAGCGPGVRVALYLPVDWQYLVVLLALIRMRAVACPLNTRIPSEGIIPLLHQIACRLLLVAEEHVAGAVGEGVAVVPVHAVVQAREGASIEPGASVMSTEQPATIVFTSGSSGTPKAALHSFGNHYFSALGSNRNIRLRPGDRWLLSLPLYHVGGLAIVFRCLLAGAALVVPPDVRDLPRLVSDFEVTHASMVSTQLYRILDAGEGASLRGLCALLLGGGALPPPLLQEGSALGLPLHTSYGLTEMASQVTTTPPAAPPQMLRSSGRVLPHRQLRIAADGEILVRGKTLFQGYVEQAAVRRAVDADGWFHTGDTGALDEAGCLHVAGRRDFMFISGGENIQPEEVERALTRLEGIKEAVVVPVPDDAFGHRPVAFLRADPLPEPQVLRAQLSNVLPGFKIPVAFHAMPDVDTGTQRMKTDRRSLQKRAQQMRDST